MTDPLGNTTTSAYDSRDRRTTVTDARGFATVTTFDLAGNTTSVTDASGNVTRYAFDRLNRLITETDPLGAVTTSAYDLAGNKTKETDRLGRVSTFVYDAADRLVEERWQASASAAVSHTIKRFYDGSDQLLGVTETDTANPAATTAWQFAYDALGQLVKSRMAPGEIVQTPALDAFPNPPGTLAAGDSTIDWDLDGRPERYDGYSITLAVGDQLLLTASSTAFDPVLILQKPTGGLATAFFDDSSGGGTSARLFVTADVAGTWGVVVTSRDDLATGSYDLKIVKDQNALVPAALVEYDFTYDKAGNLLTTTEDQAAVAQFGALGPAASGLGVRTAYTIDALNRVTRYRHIDVATGAVLKRTDYAYRPDGSVGTVTRFAGAGVNPVGTSTAAYDSMGRLTGITHAPTASPSIAYGYAYDAASRMTSMTTPEGTSSFTLDATDQLTSASLTGEAYAYDKTGNRTSGGTVTGTGNRLLTDGTYRYAYDAEGNRTAKFVDTNAGGTLSVGDTDVTVYAYDQRNRLVAVSHVTAWTATQAAGLGAFTVSGTPLPGSDFELRYTYDYADRRIRKSLDADGQAGAGQEAVSFAAYAGDVRTLEIARPADRLVIDTATGQVIGFLGQVVQRNFYGNGVDEVLAVDKITWNGNTPTTSTFWTFTDHQDSVRNIVSGNAADRGQVVEHRQYDSFGKVVRRTIGPQAGAATTAGVGVEFAYAGRPVEARTGLSDNRARWYEPATGRFVNEDPSGFKGGDANLFRYVGNDPLNQVDPSGLAAKWASGAKASVPTAGWAALGQGAMLTTSGGAAYAPVPVATGTPLSLNSRVSNGSANATDQSGMAKRTLYQNIVREAYYLSNLMIGRRPSLNGGMEWAPRASVKPLVADIVVATPPLTPFALAGGGIALTRQGVGNFSDGIRGRALRGFDSDEIQNGVILGGVGGPVARAFPALTIPIAGVGIGAAAREFQNGEIEFAAFDAFLFAKPSTLGRSGAFGAARTGRGPFGYPSAVSTGAESAVNGLKLNKALASQAQMGEVGTTMAGAGARVPFRDATRVAKEHGGNAADWVKKSSSSYTARDGATFETHWVENVRTGQRVEFKTKFPGVD